MNPWTIALVAGWLAGCSGIPIQNMDQGHHSAMLILAPELFRYSSTGCLPPIIQPPQTLAVILKRQ